VARDTPLRPAAGLLIILGLATTAAACGGGPPRDLAGFGLGMSQEQVMGEARRLGGFTCHVQGTRPRLTTCSGPTPDGPVEVVVRDDSAVAVSLLQDPRGRRPERQVRRFVKGFGDPAWHDRPYPTRSDPSGGFHTLWLNQDSTRSLALICAGRRLQPPCTARLAVTGPTEVQASLDTLLDIQR
jgi:hypothetical protein